MHNGKEHRIHRKKQCGDTERITLGGKDCLEVEANHATHKQRRHHIRQRKGDMLAQRQQHHIEQNQRRTNDHVLHQRHHMLGNKLKGQHRHKGHGNKKQHVFGEAIN